MVGLCLVLGHVGVDTYKVYCGLDHVEDSVAGYVLRHQLVWRVDMVGKYNVEKSSSPPGMMGNDGEWLACRHD